MTVFTFRGVIQPACGLSPVRKRVKGWDTQAKTFLLLLLLLLLQAQLPCSLIEGYRYRRAVTNPYVFGKVSFTTLPIPVWGQALGEGEGTHPGERNPRPHAERRGGEGRLQRSQARTPGRGGTASEEPGQDTRISRHASTHLE